MCYMLCDFGFFYSFLLLSTIKIMLHMIVGRLNTKSNKQKKTKL